MVLYERLSLVDGEEVVAVSQMVSDVEKDVLSEEERSDNSSSLLLRLALAVAVASLRPQRRIRSSETRCIC